jgi:hypothetical protein
MSHYTPRELPILSVAKKNSTGVTIPKGSIVALSQSADDLITLATDPKAHIIFGVTREDIADGNWGDVLVLGLAEVLGGSGGFTQGKRITCGASGRAVNCAPSAADTNSLLGVSNRDGADGVLSEVWLAGPGSAIQTED